MPSSIQQNSIPTTQTTENRTNNPPGRPGYSGEASNTHRLQVLDGMRGLAALYIVLYHAAGDYPPPAPLLRFAAWFFQFGHYAVGIFIILSGFCLMLPVATSTDGRLRDGFWGYLQRRARRIFPAYYVVLAMTTVCIAIVIQQHPILSGEEAEVLNLSPGTIVSHLLLVHNLRESWAQALDPPLWTVALECQIYLLFPLLLLPIWRRFGVLFTVCSGFVLGFAPHLLLPGRFNLDWTFPWFLGLFCLGIAGASVNFSRRLINHWWTERFPWGTVGLALLALFSLIVGLHPDLPIDRMWLPDIVLGLSTMCLIVEMTLDQSIAAGRAFREMNSVCKGLKRMLEWKPLIWIGAFSYSLYLLHAPILWTLYPFIHALRFSDSSAFLFRLLVGTPVCLAVSYGFYRIVERPFLVKRR